VASVLKEGLPGKLADMEIGWKVLQRHFNSNPDSFRKIEQPHLQHEDIISADPIKTLGKLIPDTEFWDGTQHVFTYDDGTVVSMHLLDVVHNASNRLAYEEGAYPHLQKVLWEELGIRYLQHPHIETYAIEFIEKPVG
jgi:hypothetical protein